ncbi:MAG: HAD family phosphatase, partial [Deltaproteobacteria bacterium]
MAIKAVLFDFGGVVLDLQFDRSRAALQALGGRGFESIWTLEWQAPFFMDHETGKLSDAAFRDALRHH